MKPELSRGGWVTKEEELKFLLVVVKMSSYISTYGFLNSEPAKHLEGKLLLHLGWGWL